MIFTCNCSNDFQDKRYGKNKRVMNKTATDKEYRCTVCGKVHNK